MPDQAWQASGFLVALVLTMDVVAPEHTTLILFAADDHNIIICQEFYDKIRIFQVLTAKGVQLHPRTLPKSGHWGAANWGLRGHKGRGTEKILILKVKMTH